MKLKFIVRKKFPIIGHYWNHPGDEHWYKITRVDEEKVWGISNLDNVERHTFIQRYNERLRTKDAFNLAETI